MAEMRAQGRAQVENPAVAAFVIQTSVQWTGARLLLAGVPEAQVDAAIDTVSEMLARLIRA